MRGIKREVLLWGIVAKRVGFITAGVRSTQILKLVRKPNIALIVIINQFSS